MDPAGPQATALEARARFAEQAARPDPQIDLARAALWIAAEAQPGLDVARYLGELEALAALARPTVEGARSTTAAVEALCRVLFDERGFRGNADDYYDPRNSFLNDVIDRRCGIPITLSLLFVEVARRVGLDAHGIGFPGHFLAKVSTGPGEGFDGALVIDAFHGGQLLERSDCEALLRSAVGEEAELTPELLRAARPKEILSRVLSNLKQVYIRESALEDALACCDRLLLLDPEAALEIRDRGLVFKELECFAPAVRDLERFLELAPKDESAVNVRRLLEPLRKRASRIH